MRCFLRLGFLLALLALPWAAQAQNSGLPNFLQQLPGQTVVGRLSATPGPAEAIPFIDLPQATVGSASLGAIVNVTGGPYLADPTGTVDSSNEIGSVLGAKVNGINASAYAPGGTYLLTSNPVTLGQNQGLFGDPTQTTILHITTAFNPTAKGVVILTGAQSSNPGAHTLTHLLFQFDQPTASTTANGTSSSGSNTLAVNGTSILNGYYVADPTNNCIPLGTVVVSGGGTGTLTLVQAGSGGTAANLTCNVTNLETISYFAPRWLAPTLAGSPANGQIFLPTNPTNGSTVTIGGTAVTFVTSGATGNQVNIGASASATAAALVTFLNASADVNISLATYLVDLSLNTTVDVSYKSIGAGGNSFTLATNVTGGSVSGATLSAGLTGCGSPYLCKYPPAVYNNSGEIIYIDHLRCNGAWQCLDFGTSEVSWGGGTISNVQDGSLDNVYGGLIVDNMPSTLFVPHFHHWPWGGSTGVNVSVFKDQSTVASSIGNVGGSGNSVAEVHFEDLYSANGQVNISNSHTGVLFSSPWFDSPGANLNVTSCRRLTVAGGHIGAVEATQIASKINFNPSAPGSSQPICSLSIAGTELLTTTTTLSNGQPGLLFVQAGNLTVSGAQINTMLGASPTSPIQQTGGTLNITGNQFWPTSATGSTVGTGQTLISQTGGSIGLTGNMVTAVPNGGGSTFASLTDTAGNLVGPNSLNGWLLPVPGPLGQYQIFVAVQSLQLGTAIPFVLPATGTMGNNGAFTDGTALAGTYANAYIYFTANQIASGSAAGWYFAVCTTTTACTIYNNTYSSGIPIIPASPVAFATTGPGAITGDTSSQISLSIPIPGKAFSATSCLRTSPLISFTSNTDTKSLTVQYGGSTISNISVSTANVFAGGSTRTCNRGTTFSQVSAPAFQALVSGAAPNYTLIDSTTSQNLNFNLLHSTATDNIVLESASVEVVP